jgi:hypothetical protein
VSLSAGTMSYLGRWRVVAYPDVDPSREGAGLQVMVDTPADPMFDGLEDWEALQMFEAGVGEDMRASLIARFGIPYIGNEGGRWYKNGRGGAMEARLRFLRSRDHTGCYVLADRKANRWTNTSERARDMAVRHGAVTAFLLNEDPPQTTHFFVFWGTCFWAVQFVGMASLQQGFVNYNLGTLAAAPAAPAAPAAVAVAALAVPMAVVVAAAPAVPVAVVAAAAPVAPAAVPVAADWLSLTEVPSAAHWDEQRMVDEIEDFSDTDSDQELQQREAGSWPPIQPARFG